MDPVVLGVALVLGWVARQLALPPLVGFLVAGFALHTAGYESSEALEGVADMGITLLLFTIGLKLNLGTLLRPQVWGVASAHAGSVIVASALLFHLAGLAGVALLAGLDLGVLLLLGFALSFSSTVFAVKTLEERGEAASLHGSLAIGILIVQDLFAVVFLAFSLGKVPTPVGLGIVAALVVLKPLLIGLMRRCGHGELLILFGVIVAIGGAQAFENVGIKGDLGALFLGVLLGSSPNADELSKGLLGFKDLFLVGFFLSIGLSGIPSLDMTLFALGLNLLLPAKVLLFFWLLTRLRVRARTSLLTAFGLGNFSEFGLIVAGVAVKTGWLANDWLLVLALAVAVSFVLAAPLNAVAGRVFARFEQRLARWERGEPLPEESVVDPGDAVAMVLGMGRIGRSAYEELAERFPGRVVGIDSCPETVDSALAEGLRVIHGDATDASFWRRVRANGGTRLVLLALSNHDSNLQAAREAAPIRSPEVMVAAATRFGDEADELRSAGVDEVFAFFEDAGRAFAEQMCGRHPQLAGPEA